jgi:hypothetical protein
MNGKFEVHKKATTVFISKIHASFEYSSVIGIIAILYSLGLAEIR